LASLFNGKARLWVNGRSDIWQKLESLPPTPHKTVWMHCASLGEFEQGRPVLEALKKQYPQIRIVLTFFSPSGYEIRKNYAGADAVFYLPADLPGNAARFFDAVKPDLGLIVKYEFWQGYLHEAKHRGIPLFLVSGIFRADMPFFKSYGNYFRQGLRAFAQFFVQDEDSRRLLHGIGMDNVTVCGDTRLDRVLEAVEKRTPIPAIEAFKGNTPLWVCGSSWPADDALIFPILKKNKGNLKTLLVPHDIHPEYIDRLISENPDLTIVRFSQSETADPSTADVLVLDTMGMLTSAYAYADWAYVGGGFGKAVHNTMEPAAYGIPVFFGPAHRKFREITGLMQAGGGRCVQNGAELDQAVTQMLQQPETAKDMGRAARGYVEANAGATAVIMQILAAEIESRAKQSEAE